MAKWEAAMRSELSEPQSPTKQFRQGSMTTQILISFGVQRRETDIIPLYMANHKLFFVDGQKQTGVIHM